MSKEVIEKAYWEGYIAKQNEAMQICKQCKYIKKVKQLEADNYEANNIINDYIEDRQKLIEKLEEDIKNKQTLIELEYEQYKEYYARTGGYPNQMKFNVFKLTGEKNKAQEILEIVKGN